MDKKYNEIMDRIEVTPEMRERILQNISNADLSKRETAKVTGLNSKITRIAGIAAAILIVGAVGLIVFKNMNLSKSAPTGEKFYVSNSYDENLDKTEALKEVNDGEDISGGIPLESFACNTANISLDFLYETPETFIYCDKEGNWYKLYSDKAVNAINMFSAFAYYGSEDVNIEDWNCFIVKTASGTYEFRMSGIYMNYNDSTFMFDIEEDTVDSIIKYFLEYGEKTQADLELCNP